MPEPADRAHPSNLPLPLTSFIGREEELATVRQMLGETHRRVRGRPRW